MKVKGFILSRLHAIVNIPEYLYEGRSSQSYTQVWTTSAEIAQLGERQTEDLKVPGSNPESSHEL